MTIKLEVGKKYVCRSTWDVKYVTITEHLPNHNFPFKADMIFNNGYILPFFYLEDGRPCYDTISNFDLVAEYVEPEQTTTKDDKNDVPDNLDLTKALTLVSQYLTEGRAFILNQWLKNTPTTEEEVIEWANENIDEKHQPEGEAKRYNKGKVALTMFSPIAMAGTCRVLEYGRKKYSTEDKDARDNWRNGKGLSLTETVDSMLRHLLLFLAGQDRDEESGELHIDHIGCNAMFLQEMVHLGRCKDDQRYSTAEQQALLQQLLTTPVKDGSKK